VQSGDVEIALGTDTGGSVRLPAAYTGIVGYKPSYGMLSRWGVVPYANSLDTVGLMAKSVGKVREVWEGLYAAGHDGRDPTSLGIGARGRCESGREGYDSQSREKLAHRGVKGLVFGLPLEYNIAELDPAIRDAWVDIARKLQSFGARVMPVNLPSTRHALSAYYVIAPAEASSNLAKYDGIRYGPPGVPNASQSDAAGDVLYSETRGNNFGEEVKRRILLGSYTLSSEAMDNYFIQAQKVRRLVQRDFDRVFRLRNPLREPETFDLSEMDETIQLENKLGPTEVDFIICPTAPTMPPTLEEVEKQTSVDSYMNDVFTVPASLAGLPAVSVPMRVGGNGTGDGVGLQVIGQYWDDARLLFVAEEIQRVSSSAAV
jgi:aspartyl-tRNA(Asn)/glutamyl-tRNA(Gln) amidotransferase subunit A